MRWMWVIGVLVAGCETPPPEITDAQREEAAALAAQLDEVVARKMETLREQVSAKVGPEGPLMPRPDQGPCEVGVEAAVLLEAEPLPPFEPEDGDQAEQRLAERRVAVASPKWTSSHVIVPTYEIPLKPAVDAERMGFEPGVGRAWVAVVEIATGSVVCVGTSGIQATTTDMQIRRRPVPGNLVGAEREKRLAENQRLMQQQVEEGFEAQLVAVAREHLAKAGPLDPKVNTEPELDEKRVRQALGR